MGPENCVPPATVPPLHESWYAVRTRARHEKAVARQLAGKSVRAFVPTEAGYHAWSDRKKLVESPLFPCYIFVRTSSWELTHYAVIRTAGVLGWVGPPGRPVAIPDDEIDAVQTIASRNIAATPWSGLVPGQRVRVRGGCLNGLEATVVEDHRHRRLVFSIGAIRQSIAITLDGYDVVPI